MQNFFANQNSWTKTPPLSVVIQPYKILALSIKKESELLTTAQHRVAAMYGEKDWRSLTYKFQTLLKQLEKLNFTVDDWTVIFEATNGWGVSMDEPGGLVNSLASNVSDFETPFLGNFSYSTPPSTLSDKLFKISEEQAQAIVAKALGFWGRYFHIRN